MILTPRPCDPTTGTNPVRGRSVLLRLHRVHRLAPAAQHPPGPRRGERIATLGELHPERQLAVQRRPDDAAADTHPAATDQWGTATAGLYGYHRPAYDKL